MAEPGNVADPGGDDRAGRRPDPGQLLDHAVLIVPGEQLGAVTRSSTVILLASHRVSWRSEATFQEYGWAAAAHPATVIPILDPAAGEGLHAQPVRRVYFGPAASTASAGQYQP